MRVTFYVSILTRSGSKMQRMGGTCEAARNEPNSPLISIFKADQYLPHTLRWETKLDGAGEHVSQRGPVELLNP